MFWDSRRAAAVSRRRGISTLVGSRHDIHQSILRSALFRPSGDICSIHGYMGCYRCFWFSLFPFLSKCSAQAANLDAICHRHRRCFRMFCYLHQPCLLAGFISGHSDDCTHIISQYSSDTILRCLRTDTLQAADFFKATVLSSLWCRVKMI